MTRGAKPGERRGGRAKGTPNMKTVEKALIAARAAGTPNAPLMLGKETLMKFGSIFEGLAATYQPRKDEMLAASQDARLHEVFLKKMVQFERWARLTIDCARAVMPHQSPTFRAIITTPDVAKAAEAVEVWRIAVFDNGKLIEHNASERRDE